LSTPEPPRRRLLADALSLPGSIGLCLLAGGLGAWATASSVRGWYLGIIKPGWNPPAWVFGPVWTTLYFLMGISAWLVWRERHRVSVRWPLAAFVAQLVLNTTWSFLFFGLRSPGLAAIEIVFLLAAITLTIRLFSPVSRWAAGLMVPYLAWVAFASVLNVTIWWLNRLPAGA